MNHYPLHTSRSSSRLSSLTNHNTLPSLSVFLVPLWFTPFFQTNPSFSVFPVTSSRRCPPLNTLKHRLLVPSLKRFSPLFSSSAKTMRCFSFYSCLSETGRLRERASQASRRAPTARYFSALFPSTSSNRLSHALMSSLRAPSSSAGELEDEEEEERRRREA